MMIPVALLAAYAVVVGTVGRRLLHRLTHRTGHPLLGALVWLIACGSVLVAGLTAGLLAAGWHLPAFASVVVERCLTAAEAPHDHVHLTVPGLAVPALAALGMRAAWVTFQGYATEARLRRRHVQAVLLVGRAHRDLGAVVVEAVEPAVYCVAGRHPTIVVTTRALQALSAAQLAAVLEHERCHLAERHHVLLRAGNVVARAFPFVPLFRETRTNVAGLLEMRADDVAVRRHGARPLADALRTVASNPPVGGPALAAGGPSAGARAHRLLADHDSAAHGDRWRLYALTAAFIIGPAATLLVPFCG